MTFVDKRLVESYLLACEPQYAKDLYALACALALKGCGAEAIAEFCKAIELDPHNAAAHLALTVAPLQKQGLDDEAIAELRRKIDAIFHCALAEVRQKRGWNEEAIAAFRKAIELDPQNAAAHYALGGALLRKGWGEEAIAEFRKATELAPQSAAAHSALGGALLRKGRGEEAIAEFRKAIALDTQNAAAHSALGEALIRKGRREEAFAEFRKVIALDPQNAVAHHALGWDLFCWRGLLWGFESCLLDRGRSWWRADDYRAIYRLRTLGWRFFWGLGLVRGYFIACLLGRHSPLRHQCFQ